MNRNFVLMALVGLLAAGGGYLASMMMAPPEQAVTPQPITLPKTPPPDAAGLIGKPMPPFALEVGGGDVVNSDQFAGQVVLVNFWATWCAPCVEEMPMLSGLHEELEASGFSVLGIAVDDPVKAREFADELDLEYPVAVGLVDTAILARMYGNTDGMLPYSVLVDRKGIVRWTFLGALEEAELKRQVSELL